MGLATCGFFVALAATQNAVLSYVVGKRSTENTEGLAMDLRARIVNRPQITSDGYTPYPGAVEAAFGWDVDFAQLTRKYVSDSSLPDGGASPLPRSRQRSPKGRDKRHA